MSGLHRGEEDSDDTNVAQRREEKARMNIDHIEREEIFCANFVFFAVNKSPNEDEWSTLRA